MGNDTGHASDVPQAGVLRVQQQGSFPIRQEAPVLHGPSSKVGNGNQVQLGEGKGDAKQLLKSRKHRCSDVESCLQVAGSAHHSSQLRAQLSWHVLACSAQAAAAATVGSVLHAAKVLEPQ